MTLYTQQDKNIRQTWLLMSLFLVIVITIGWSFAQIYKSPGILYFAVVFSLLMNFFSYWYSDKIVLKIAGARPIDKKDNPELYRIVENLCITAGLKLPKLYIINDSGPNAFATGRNQEHAVIAVTTGLLEKLNKTELEGVISHELSHIGNRDILISTIVVVLVGFIALLSDFFLRFSVFGGRSRDDNRAGAILMVAGIVLAILAPLAAILIQLAISRKREFLADSSGALLTRYPDGLASALEKISQYKMPMKQVNRATAHLYISNPFGAKKISKLFMTHPPLTERIQILRSMDIKEMEL
jgi:heat shock protein HtpX